jgi:hypothetical protein
MISNLPTLTARKVTVEIDVALAGQQISRLTDILQSKDYHLSLAERAALDGVRNLLAVMTDAEVAPANVRCETVRIDRKDVNRIRDLFMAGMGRSAIASKFGYRPLAVSRLCLGRTYMDHAYEPSEFEPPGIRKYYGTDKFPWLASLKKGSK